jgi:DNA-binding transcriptional ArsR family regulator
MTYGDTALFVALADPTRRQVFERLKGGAMSVSDIARGMPVSRPAVSQHLRVLKDAGLVADRAQGSRRIYHVDPAGLSALRAWLDDFWGVALSAYRDEIERDKEHPT